MKRILLSACLLSAYFAAYSQSPQQVIQKSFEAFGGESKIKQSLYFQSERIGYENLLEQSERFEGPYIKMYKTKKEAINLENHTAEISDLSTLLSASTSVFLLDKEVCAFKNGEKISPYPASAQQDLDFHPLQILFTALQGTDLKMGADKQIQGVPNYVIQFVHKGVPTELYINKFTGLPTGYKQTAYRPGTFSSIWGDAESETLFSFWTIESNGLRFPHQIDVTRNGLPFSSFYTTKLEFKAKDSLSITPIPENVSKLYRERLATKDLSPVSVTPEKVNPLAEGIIQIPGLRTNHVPGTYNSSIVDQGDGLVIIEAPVSSWYSKSIIAYAHSAYPGKKIKAVISTSDAWPHLGGLREFAAQNIPVYYLERNTPIVTALLKARFSTRPDSLALAGKKAAPKLIPVSEKMILKGAKNSLELFPVNSESGERMMMVYLPGSELLYASDLVQKNADGTFFMEQYPSEIVDAVNREHLNVKQIFAMHTGLVSWGEITEAVKKALKE